MSTTKSAVLLEHYLKTLKLPTMLREHAKLAALCQQERAGPQTGSTRSAAWTKGRRSPASAPSMGNRSGPAPSGTGTSWRCLCRWLAPATESEL